MRGAPYLLADATKKALPVSNTKQGLTIKLPGHSPDAMDSVVAIELQSDKWPLDNSYDDDS